MFAMFSRILTSCCGGFNVLYMLFILSPIFTCQCGRIYRYFPLRTHDNSVSPQLYTKTNVPTTGIFITAHLVLSDSFFIIE